MTQENENSVSSGVSAPEKSPAKPKKTATRKTSEKKTPVAKPAVKKAAAPKKEAAAKADTKKPAAKKPAEPKAEPKTESKAEPKAATGKKPAGKTAAAKTASAKKTAEKPKAAAKKTAEATEESAKPAKKTTAKAKAPAARKSAVKEKDVSAPEAAPQKSAPPKTASGAKKATPKKAEKTERAKSEPATPEAVAPEAVRTEAAPEAAPEASLEQKDEAPRSSSRRSRRGGRRRNKKTAQPASEDAALQEADAPEDMEKPGDEIPGPEDAAAPKEAGKKPQKNAKSSDKAAASSSGKQATKSAKKGESKKAEPENAKTASGKRKMFISVLSGELVEVVLAEEGQVQEYYVEMQHQAKVKGNIYKGVVSNIDANLQAAFVSYAGGVKNGFLQIDEVHPEYYVAHHDPAKGRKFPPIQKVLKPGQEILVQVVKEPAGTKGAFLTSYLSLPGRFLVLTPGREQIGVSRKVESDAERARLRTILEGLSLGAGLGVIVRTVSTDASKTSLSRDLQFLKRLWKEVRAKGQTHPSPSLIYEELDLSTRAIRDYLTDDVQEVWVDDEDTAKQVAELASLLFPKKQNLVQVHRETGNSLFERFSLQKQLDQIHSREVSLPSGGRLVIDNTEALTAIDINSGRSSGKTNFEDMAFRTNLEAAKAIPSQLRLRDIGGQVVIDFIEMRDRDHWREVEKAVRSGMKGDRARYDVGKISSFGLLEIVRQRLGSSAISVSTEPCPCCKGTGIRRNMEWQAMQCLRDIGRALRQAAANNQTALTYPAEEELAFYLLNAKRSILQKMEEDSGVTLAIRPAGE